MALKNEDGVYLKVIKVDLPDNVVVYKYRDETVRKNGAGEFDKVVQDAYYCPDLETEAAKNASNLKSVKDNLITAAYKALKKLPMFENWEDA